MGFIHRNGKILIFLLVISIIGNIVLFIFWRKEADNHMQFITLEKKYPLISKRVLQGAKNDITVSFLSLREQLKAIVGPYQDSFAFYFEYLPTGTSIGVNEDSEFTAASLLKVPIVMAYKYKNDRLGIEKDPTVKLQKNELNDRYGSLYRKGAGYEVNLADAVRMSIVESDNTASLLLADQISNDDFKYVYEGLDIPMALKGDSPIITAIQYTSVLKSLYFSSILEKEDSQEILDLMTKTKFNDMLPAGVPKNVPVAHKIGLIDKEIYQDCGIVYVPNRPYALCMISKSDNDTARKRMQHISRKVYEYVSGNEK